MLRWSFEGASTDLRRIFEGFRWFSVVVPTSLDRHTASHSKTNNLAFPMPTLVPGSNSSYSFVASGQRGPSFVPKKTGTKGLENASRMMHCLRASGGKSVFNRGHEVPLGTDFKRECD